MSDMSDPKKRRFHLIIVLAVLVGAIILLIAAERGSIVPAEPAEDATSGALQPPAEQPVVAQSEEAYNGTTAVRAFGAAAAIPPAPAAERSPLADALNRNDRTADQDLEVVASLFASYQDLLHELPVGTNAEITAALAGDNGHGHAPLPADHPAINDAGELTDRWGTPFFFHQLAADQVEIRSAGPDHRMYSEDDFVWPQHAEQTWTNVAAQLVGSAR